MRFVLPTLLALLVAVLGSDAARVLAQVPSPARPTAPAAATPVPVSQVPEIWLMLKNGSTFAARMLSAGERVKLRVNDGDIEIRASEIALTGYSLNDLAEQQWALLHQQQLDKQFPFVDWCARYHLYDYADAALTQMAQSSQDLPRVKGYQVRLARLREIHAEQQAALAQLAAAPSAAPTTPIPPAVPPALPQPAVMAPVATAPVTPAPLVPAPLVPAVPATAQLPLATPTLPATPALPAVNTAASLASAPSSTPSLLLPASPPAPPASLKPTATLTPAKPHAIVQPNSESDLAANVKAAVNSPNPGNLPPAAVELFSARVQPWVVSRCSNVGCHDNGAANSYKLERYSKQEAIPRATTLKNLAATTRLILSDKPEESPLLVMSNRAHGTSVTPPLTAGDAYAMAAFREFVTLATGRELPKEIKPEPTSTNALNNLPGQVTPGRATFPASAAEEPAQENKAAKVINQNAAGWQAAIERQRAYDAEAQKLKNIETSSQRANEARGLTNDVNLNSNQNALTSKPVQAELLLPQKSATALPASAPAGASSEQPEVLRNLPAEVQLFDNDAAKARVANEAASAVKPATYNAEVPVALPKTKPNPNALPESLLPKSIAKSRVKPDALPAEEPVPALAGKEPLSKSPALSSSTSPSLQEQSGAKAKPPINLNRPRRQFPLPPEDTPPPKAIGTGEIKKR